ncbi:hypothetical protein OL67_003486 [Phaeobacter piscinae]|nr:hypothetical protein OL67_003486 [Phaeobacter piscinae]
MGTGHLYLNRVLSGAGAGDQVNSHLRRLTPAHLTSACRVDDDRSPTVVEKSVVPGMRAGCLKNMLCKNCNSGLSNRQL